MHSSIRTYLAVSLLAGLGACASQTRRADDGLPPPPPSHIWHLVWNDEFGGSGLDGSKWKALGNGVRREGYWSRDDAFVDGDGYLLLRTRRHDGRVYSGAISSEGRFRRRFGLWAIRCKFGSQPGHWPAFWLYSQHVERVGDEGRDGTEIDVVEKPSLADVIDHNLHWDGYGASHRTVGKHVRVKGVDRGFHTFAVYWTPTEYVFFVDGRETWRTAAGGVSQVPEFALITDEVDSAAGRIGEAKLPDYFVVDWVRVYAAEPLR
jgi:beta-glucanase (GH16 family)